MRALTAIALLQAACTCSQADALPPDHPWSLMRDRLDDADTIAFGLGTVGGPLWPLPKAPTFVAARKDPPRAIVDSPMLGRFIFEPDRAWLDHEMYTMPDPLELPPQALAVGAFLQHMMTGFEDCTILPRGPGDDGHPGLSLPFPGTWPDLVQRFDCPGVAETAGLVYIQVGLHGPPEGRFPAMSTAWLAAPDRFLWANLGDVVINPHLGAWFDRDHRELGDPWPPMKPVPPGRDYQNYLARCGTNDCMPPDP